MGWLNPDNPKDKDCPACKGKGSVNGGLGNQVTCGVCKGTGKRKL